MKNYTDYSDEALWELHDAAWSEYYAQAIKPCGDWRPGASFPDLEKAAERLDAISREIERRNA